MPRWLGAEGDGDTDKDEQARLGDRADDLTVDGDAGLGDSLNDCAHSRAGYLAGCGHNMHTYVMTVNPVLAEVIRSGFKESWHRGSAVGLAADGTPVVSVGEPDVPCFPRSANKPMQGTAMLRLGLDLDGELLALACASHSGEDFHVDGVRKILSGAGLSEDDLRCPPAMPRDAETLRRLLASGEGTSRIRMNCSGKHAGMLATAALNGWPTEGYLDPDHPVQQAIRRVVEELTGEEVTATGVDGCGAPVFALTLTGVARAFRTLVASAEGTPERRVAEVSARIRSGRAAPPATSGG